MSKGNQLKVVGIEVIKLTGGFMAGRVAVVMGEKALKVNEEADPKKKKLKEVGVGLGVAALGTAIAVKAPMDFKSVGAGMATAGVISAMSPFGTEDKGFIPVLHGYDAEGNYIDSSVGETDSERAEREFREFEAEEERELNALSALEGEELEDEVLNGKTTETLN